MAPIASRRCPCTARSQCLDNVLPDVDARQELLRRVAQVRGVQAQLSRHQPQQRTHRRPQRLLDQIAGLLRRTLRQQLRRIQHLGEQLLQLLPVLERPLQPLVSRADDRPTRHRHHQRSQYAGRLVDHQALERVDPLVLQALQRRLREPSSLPHNAETKSSLLPSSSGLSDCTCCSHLVGIETGDLTEHPLEEVPVHLAGMRDLVTAASAATGR